MPGAHGRDAYRRGLRENGLPRAGAAAFGAEVRCSGRTVWVLCHNGVASSQEAYVGVRSGDGGRTRNVLLAERYFGVEAPFQIDEYAGPWTLVGERAAFFVGR